MRTTIPAPETPAVAPVLAAQPGGRLNPQRTLRAVEPDFWDISDPEFTRNQAPVPMDTDYAATDRVSDGSNPRTHPLAIGLLLALLAILSYAAYQQFVLGEDPLDKLLVNLDSIRAQLSGDTHPADEFPALERRPHKLVKQPASPKAEASSLNPKAQANPYWHLPNQIVGVKRAAKGEVALSAEDETIYSKQLKHPFPYQHYKTVQDIRKRAISGSENVLRQALHDDKLWTRLYAAVGLAELKTPVPIETLDQALSGARSELVANFFERFTHHPNAGQSYILRQAVRLVDERGRLVALRGIAASRDELRDLYLAAATRDTSPRVQKWVQSTMRRKPIEASRWQSLLTQLAAPHDVMKPENQIPDTEMKKQKNAEMEKEFANFSEEKSTSTAGEVTFYDDVEDSKPSDEDDPETFDAD